MVNEAKQLIMLDMQDIKTDKICVSFKDKPSACPQFVGAKGASLALLSSVETDDVIISIIKLFIKTIVIERSIVFDCKRHTCIAR